MSGGGSRAGLPSPRLWWLEHKHADSRHRKFTEMTSSGGPDHEVSVLHVDAQRGVWTSHVLRTDWFWDWAPGAPSEAWGEPSSV